MTDVQDDGFDEAFEGFGEDDTTVDDTSTTEEVEQEDVKQEEAPTDKGGDKEEEGQKDEQADEQADDKPEAEQKDDTQAEEQPKPLTEDSIRSIINELRTEERSQVDELKTTTDEILNAYYPEGLSNVLYDKNTNKKLRTPQDVVDASGGDMTIEEATQWLMNEQYKLDQDIARVKQEARAVAETTVKFKQDSRDVLRRYEPLFKAYPQVQKKVWEQYKKLMKVDEAKGAVISAPDMREFYDTMLEPYRMAFEYSEDKSATQSTEEVVKPGAEDRLDEDGDGGASEANDPSDFAQQVKKELAKGF